MAISKASVDVVPIMQRAAREWVNETHRHLSAPRGDLYRTSLTVDGVTAAVGMAGRPCRQLHDGRTVEILRIASVATVETNACSRLYARLIQAGKALGYRRFVTYTLPSEPGTSLRAAGFEDDGLTEGGEYNCPSRPRKPVEQSSPKRRWLSPGRNSGYWKDLAPGKLAAIPVTKESDHAK
jgi:hypothetical protein